MIAALWLVAIAMGADGDPHDRLVATFPPKLAEVARPLPPLAVRSGAQDAAEVDKLRWMAELAGRVDDRHQLSQSEEWRAIMGWSEPSLRLLPQGQPLDEGLERYPVPGGRADPATDFRASLALAWLDARRFSCQFPLRARFLSRAELTPPGPLPIERGACPAFRAWLDPETVDVEVIYVAQRWQDASATMGHVVFRLRRRDGDHVVGASSEVAFAYVAKDPSDTPGYLWKGLTGELSAGVELERFGDMWARYGVLEGRDLHVYRLNLSDEERLFLLAEVFAQSRHRMRVPYAFLTVNCATMAWDTLRALLPELPEHNSVLVHPHEVISMLLAAGRVTPRGVIPARKSLARDAERRREALGERLGNGAARAAHEARWRSPEARADALRALTAELKKTPDYDPALVAWADLTLDIEAFALDQATHGYKAGATGPALEAALDLRALLPVDPTRLSATEPIELTSEPKSGVRSSGSRRAELAGKVMFEDRALIPAASWVTSVLDEQVGDARQVSLNPGARMRLLVNELVLALDGDAVAIERDRLVLIDSLTLGDTVRTDNGWLSSRLGFGFGAELTSLPRAGVPLTVRVHGGPVLTLAASRGFSDHLALGLELDLATWTRVAHGDALLRVSAALVLDAAVGLGSSRVRLRGRAAPGFDFGGAVLELGASLSIEVPLSESGPTLIMSALWAHGQPIAQPLEAGLGLAF